MSIRSHKLLRLGLAAGLILGAISSAGAADRQPAPDLESRLQEQMGIADFSPAGRPRQPLLVVLVDVTKDGAVARDTGLELILGQPKRNDATPDLLVEATAGDTPVASYRVADPRFSEMENFARNTSRTAVLRVFVPLSADIDLVSISAIPGREDLASAGGSFDPRPLMAAACEGLSAIELRTQFPQCTAVRAMGIHRAAEERATND